MDNHENLIIFDVQLMNSVEKSDVCKKQILCQSINTSSSKLHLEATLYHHSVQSFKGRLCILVIIIYLYLYIYFLYIY